MTQLREVAYLELDTFSLAGTSDINTQKSNWTYRNIDLRKIMGDEMWNKYDKFTLRLQQLNINGTNTFSSTSKGVIAYNMAGLDWINIYYETGGYIKKWAPIFQVLLGNGSQNQKYMYSNPSTGFNFRKGSPFVNLEFMIYPIENSNFNIVTGETYNNNQMAFTIEPAEDNENEMGVMILNTISSLTSITPGKVMTNNNNVFTYNNFNIKDVCQEFWNKYDDFEIIYQSYTSTGLSSSLTYITGAQNVVIKGFDYINNFEGIGNGQYETDGAVLGCNKFGIGSTHIWDYSMPSRTQFKKSNETMTLQLQFRNYNNDGISSHTGATNRRWQGIFFIKPIRKELGCCDKATLVLSGAGLTTTASSFGVTNSTETDTTWFNVDLRMACRGFWDKYKKFNIFFTQSQNNITNANATQQCLMLYMKGLNFETPYNNDTSISSDTWTVGGIMEGHTISTPNIFQASSGNTKGIMFNKSSDIVNINLFVKTINNIALTASGCLNGTFIFTIVGVEE